jgi:hypothetical protein
MVAKKARKAGRRPDQQQGKHVPAQEWAPEQLAVVGREASAGPTELRHWLADFEALHRPVDPQALARIPAQHPGPQLVPPTAIPGLDRLCAIVEHLEQTQAWLSATHALIGADAEDPGALLDTTALLRSVMNLFDHVQGHSLTLQAALGVVARAEPLATVRRDGSRWGGKLKPVDLLSLAEAAPTAAGTTTYLAGRADRALAESTHPNCDGGPGKKHCRGTRVRLADGTRASSCWAHLNPQQKAAIRAERDAALQRPCPLCQAAAGQPCVDLDRANTTIHNHRLRPTAQA